MADCVEVKGQTWDFAGKQLDIKNALALCSIHGWHRRELVTAVAVMTAESQRYTKAWHINMADDCITPLSTDRGLFQINDKAHPTYTEEELFTPCTNVEAAKKIYVGRARSFNAWAAYNSGAYLKYVDAIQKEWDKPGWKLRIPKWEMRCST